MLGVPSNLIFTLHSLNYTSRGKTYTSSVLFLRVTAFFCIAHRKIGRPGGGLCHCKISILIFALLRICALSVQSLHWNCIFYIAKKNVFCSVKNVNALCLFWAASWSRVFFTLHCKTKQCKTERMFWVVKLQFL